MTEASARQTTGDREQTTENRPSSDSRPPSSVIDPRIKSGDDDEAVTDPRIQSGDDDEAVTDEAVDHSAAEEFDEIEYGEGKKHRLPKELKPLLMFQADYTRKTQEVAEARRALEAERTHWSAQRDQQLAADLQRTALIGKLINADEQIARYQKLDWAALRRDDPPGAQEKFMELQQWKDHRDTLAHGIRQYDAERAQEVQRATAHRVAADAQRLEEAHFAIRRDIPTWDADAPKIWAYAQSRGLSREELVGLRDVRLAKVLHDAMIGAELTAKQKAAQQQRADRPPAEQPVPQVTARKGGAPAAQGRGHGDLRQAP
jgi:hypothetical protein